MTKVLFLRVDDELHEELTARAKKNDRSANKEAINIIRNELKAACVIIGADGRKDYPYCMNPRECNHPKEK